MAGEKNHDKQQSNHMEKYLMFGPWDLCKVQFYLTSSLMNGKMGVKNHYLHIWKLVQISMKAENSFQKEKDFSPRFYKDCNIWQKKI